MAPQERISQIRELIEKEEKVTVSEVSTLCNVTEETVRKDFDKLEKEGVLIRVHGGAIASQKPDVTGIHFHKRRKVHAKEKKAIAKLAQRLISEKNTVFADASSTVVETLINLPETSDLTVVTNSTELFLGLAQTGIHVISTGGEFNNKTLSLQGPVTRKILDQYRVDLAVISCKALDCKKGVQDSDQAEAEVKEMMVQQAKEVALLVDHSKFEKTALVKMMDCAKLDYLITDRKPSNEWIEFCQEKDIRLIFE